MRRLTILVLIASFCVLGWAPTGPNAHAQTVTIHPSTAPVANSANATANREETVSFNTKSLKYHCITCSAAKRCTRNCFDIPLSDAKARGGIACKICGGTCRR